MWIVAVLCVYVFVCIRLEMLECSVAKDTTVLTNPSLLPNGTPVGELGSAKRPFNAKYVRSEVNISVRSIRRYITLETLGRRDVG